MQAAARVIGVQIAVVGVRSENDFDTAFTKIVQQRADAVVIGTDVVFNSARRREQLSVLTTRHAMPAIGSARDFVAAGGLIS
jgi:ABC-type uncharacterized transport system substrate-binding protein